jgi:hypothetical protein
MEYNKTAPKNWVKAIIITASAYFIIWGFVIMFFPGLLFNSKSIQLPNYLFLWQTLGLVETLMGIGLLLSVRNTFAGFIL